MKEKLKEEDIKMINLKENDDDEKEKKEEIIPKQEKVLNTKKEEDINMINTKENDDEKEKKEEIIPKQEKVFKIRISKKFIKKRTSKVPNSLTHNQIRRKLSESKTSKEIKYYLGLYFETQYRE